MWPFKKKNRVLELIPKTFTTVICIPGTWNNWKEFVLSIVDGTKGEYIAAVDILMNLKTYRNYIVEFCKKDENMREAFRVAGSVSGVTGRFLNEIEDHKSVVYISGVTGCLEEAEHIAFAAEAILNCGGLGVKIESAGKAFEKRKWQSLLENFKESNLYEMFAVDSILGEDGTVYSCGMQNLGYRDTIVSNEELQDAIGLIKIFGYYQVVDKPFIVNNQTFSEAIGAPKFRITDEMNQPNEGEELLENPFGMWRLTRE